MQVTLNHSDGVKLGHFAGIFGWIHRVCGGSDSGFSGFRFICGVGLIVWEGGGCGDVGLGWGGLRTCSGPWKNKVLVEKTSIGVWILTMGFWDLMMQLYHRDTECPQRHPHAGRSLLRSCTWGT